MRVVLQLIIAFAIIAQTTISCQSETKKKNELSIGIQTYSFRTMEDQSPLAILEYIK
jgi:outer membrane murein-binding lipoprotein Lpp